MTTEIYQGNAIMNGDVRPLDDLPPEDMPYIDTSNENDNEIEEPLLEGADLIRSNLELALENAVKKGYSSLLLTVDGKKMGPGHYAFLMARKMGLSKEDMLGVVAHAGELSKKLSSQRATNTKIGKQTNKSVYDEKPWEGHDSGSRAAGDY